jgi:ubiquinone/menaquinone biosynthesis C-methylase UbiE
MKQKEVFLATEGDAWLARNRASLTTKQENPNHDPVLRELTDFLPAGAGSGLRILEIGCGDGSRLAWISRKAGADCVGIDPSTEAILATRAKGVEAVRGTADSLQFEDRSFDIVIFGFCLYLCDREDLFRIAAEVDRVLRSPGWLVIHDFFSPSPIARPYHHHSGVWSYKMDYRCLFAWHPDYVCVTHKVRHHDDATAYTDSTDDWVAVSVLRKRRQEPTA